MPPLRFETTDQSIRVTADYHCVAHWVRYRQTRIWQPESGGLLFAPSVGSHDGIVQIARVSGPTVGDRRRRYSLEFDYRQCRFDIAEQFKNGLHFVGYWHTHPEKDPTLSRTDRRAFVKNLQDGGLEIERMIAVVVGNGTGLSAVNVCVVGANEIIPLRLGARTGSHTE